MYALNEIIQPILEGMTGQEAADVIQSNLELLDGTKAPISTVEDIKGLQAEQVELSNKIEEVKETIPTVEVGTVTPVKGIHPSQEGHKAIFDRISIDCPFLLNA